MLWFCCWVVALWTYEQGLEDGLDLMRPPTWAGNYWGPAASRARSAGRLPPLPSYPGMARWDRWGRDRLREGDIVFRLGDARGLHGIFALSRFIARATGSPFSHTGIVAIEDGSPVIYDSSAEGVRRVPFDLWMVDCVGSFGVKRLKVEHRRHIPGVIGFCRKVFEQEVPFDFAFRLDDSGLYCLELTEKAFRSQGLRLSEPVRIGDWENLTSYPITAFAMPFGTRLAVGQAITLEQQVYVPGNDRQGVWASPLLETVFGPEPKGDRRAAPGQPGGISLRGDLDLAAVAAGELRRSYSELPARLLWDLCLHPQVRELFRGRLVDVAARRGQPTAPLQAANP